MPIPAAAGVRAVFWLESSPRRTLAIAAATSSFARVAIDTSEKLTLHELPGGRYLADADGRFWVIDLATSAVVRSFQVVRSRPTRVAKDVLLLDVGNYISGFDDLFFDPSSAPRGRV